MLSIGLNPTTQIVNKVMQCLTRNKKYEDGLALFVQLPSLGTIIVVIVVIVIIVIIIIIIIRGRERQETCYTICRMFSKVTNNTHNNTVID